MDWEKIRTLDSGLGSTIQDYHFLYGLVMLLQPRRIIEIGRSTGVSTVVMAQALKDLGYSHSESKIVTIDPDESTAVVAVRQLEEFGLKQYVENFTQRSPEGTRKALEVYGSFQLALIDGDHSYPAVRADYLALKDAVAYMVFHDASSEGVSKLLTELRDSGEIEIAQLLPFAKGQQWSVGEVVWESSPGIAVVRGYHRSWTSRLPRPLRRLARLLIR